MKLQINGEPRTFPALPTPLTLAVLLETLGMKPDRVAIELNRDIVPRDRWAETQLREGDQLEIVHFVGGGADARLLPPGRKPWAAGDAFRDCYPPQLHRPKN